MKKIDIQNFKKYYRNVDGNGTVARVGHVNYVIDGLTEDFTRDYVFTTGTDAQSSFNKINNYNITVQGTKFDFYSLQAYMTLSGSNVYAIPIGYITTSSLSLNLGSSSSIVLANDSFLQDLTTPLGVGALVTETSTGDVIPISFMGINVDNTITTPDEYYIFLIAATPVPFECTIGIDIQVGVVAGSTVEYNII